MTDRYENIRKALAMGPTPGPWEVWDDVIYDDNDNFHVLRHFVTAHEADVVGAYGVEADRPSAKADATHIAACDPDAIRELLAERDALENRVAQMLDALRSAEALAFCCMAEDCYSRREIRDMAEASAPRYTAAIAAENGGGNE